MTGRGRWGLVALVAVLAGAPSAAGLGTARVALPSGPATRAQPAVRSAPAGADRAAPPDADGLRGVPSPAGPGLARASLRGRWTWPLRPTPAVVHKFRAPPSRYGAGHRGVDLAAAPGGQVLAVDAGRVAHVGAIAGRGTVTVLHASGIRSTYEPVTSAMRAGEAVARGQPVGTIEPVPGHCAPRTCLHLGALRGRTYLDPLLFLAPSHVILLRLN